MYNGQLFVLHFPQHHLISPPLPPPRHHLRHHQQQSLKYLCYKWNNHSGQSEQMQTKKSRAPNVSVFSADRAVSTAFRLHGVSAGQQNSRKNYSSVYF